MDVCERVDRQLRSVADALAWRVFNYDRRVIVAFSRNYPPGPMYYSRRFTLSVQPRRFRDRPAGG